MKMQKSYLFSLLALIVILGGLAACSSNDAAQKRDLEIANLARYVKENNLVALPTDTIGGVKYYFTEQQAGHGDSIRYKDNVMVYYSAHLVDGTIFSSTGVYDPLVIYEALNYSSQVPNGLIEILHRRMKTGSKARIVIPSSLAWSMNGHTISSYGLFLASVPAYSTVIYDIEVYRVYREGELVN
ncbi:MAG: FKBP-type peptidyl-prolyl cis-trans isomerase [Bacteroidota bacterium]|nr:FKBP-type peptidyl-prolyl cis-trans isomerase [Bacteroidota bacterium]MDP4205950.1 FKBP-type peptidyl-prolyl cis-trans isomerase [Bacteroidota bacterium]